MYYSKFIQYYRSISFYIGYKIKNTRRVILVLNKLAEVKIVCVRVVFV